MNTDMVVNLLINYITLNCEISQEQQNIIKYALNAIINELLKFIFLLCIFLITHRINFFLFSLIILTTIRTFSGGLHFETFIGCLIFTTIFFILTCLVFTVIPRLPNLTYYFVSIFSFFVICVKSPCPSVKRPIMNTKKRQKLKLLSSFFTIIWLYVLSCCIKDVSLFNCGISTILFQAIQLILERKER